MIHLQCTRSGARALISISGMAPDNTKLKTEVQKHLPSHDHTAPNVINIPSRVTTAAGPRLAGLGPIIVVEIWTRSEK